MVLDQLENHLICLAIANYKDCELKCGNWKRNGLEVQKQMHKKSNYRFSMSLNNHIGLLIFC